MVRPLSAKILPPTLPEQEGVIDRARLLDISATGAPPVRAAKHHGITDIPQPRAAAC